MAKSITQKLYDLCKGLCHGLLLLLCLFSSAWAQLLPLESGWLKAENGYLSYLNNEGTSYKRVNIDLEASFSSYSLLTSNDEGSLILLQLFGENNESYIALYQHPNTWQVLSLEGHDTRLAFVSPSSSDAIILLTDGNFYHLYQKNGHLAAKKLDSPPAAVIADAHLDAELNFSWVNPNGQIFRRTLNTEDQIEEIFTPRRSVSNSPLYAFFDRHSNSWWIKPSKEELLRIGLDRQLDRLGKVSFRPKARLKDGLMLGSDANGNLWLFHPLFPRYGQQLPLIGEQILLNGEEAIAQTTDPLTFDASIISSSRDKLLTRLQLQRRIAIEEATNQWAAAHLNRSDDQYLAQKEAKRAQITEWLQSYLLGQAAPLPAQPSSNIAAQNAPVHIDQLRWEDQSLNAKVALGEEVQFDLIAKQNLSEGWLPELQNGFRFLSSERKGANRLQIRLQAPKSPPTDHKGWTLIFANQEVLMPFDAASMPKSEQWAIEWLDGVAEAQLLLRFKMQNHNGEMPQLQLLPKAVNTPPLLAKVIAKGASYFEGSVTIAPHQIAQEYTLELRLDSLLILETPLQRSAQKPYRITAPEIMPSGHPLLQKLTQQAKSNENNRTFALIIGNQAYQHAPSADYALRDARLFKTYMQEQWALPAANIIHLENAQLSDFEYYLGNEDTPGRLADLLGSKPSRLIVYYSGHGLPKVEEPGAYLLPVDGRLTRPDITALDLGDFYERLRVLPQTETLVFLESCFSGQSGNGDNLIPDASGVGIRLNNPLLAKDNTAVFSAAGPNELASWNHSYGTGIFTAKLLNAFRALGSQNQAAISIERLQDWLNDPELGVAREASLRYSRQQQPFLQTNNPDLPLFTPAFRRSAPGN